VFRFKIESKSSCLAISFLSKESPSNIFLTFRDLKKSFPTENKKMHHSKTTPKLRLVVAESDDQKAKIATSSPSIENEKNQQETSIQTCTHVFMKGKKKNQRCINTLPADPHPHGNDRYCISCQSKDPVKAILEDEILRDCENHDCQNPVLKMRTSHGYGEDRFCKFCLADSDIRDKLHFELMEFKEQQEHEKEQQENDQAHDQFEQKTTEKSHIFTHEDLLRLHESLGKPIFQTKKISEYLDANLRYLIEVVLCNHPIELAKVLFHFCRCESTNWESMNPKTLKGKLIHLKHDLVKRLVSQLNCVPFPSSKLKAKNEIVQQLHQLQCDLKSEVIDLFEYEIQKDRLQNNPLSKFVAEKISITGAKSDSLFTQTIFDAFKDWSQKCLVVDESLLKSSSNFGKRLKHHVIGEHGTKPLWTIGNYGPKTCHFGIKLKK